MARLLVGNHEGHYIRLCIIILFDILDHFSRISVPPHTRRATCCIWCPFQSDADWCLQRDVLPDSPSVTVLCCAVNVTVTVPVTVTVTVTVTDCCLQCDVLPDSRLQACTVWFKDPTQVYFMDGSGNKYGG